MRLNMNILLSGISIFLFLHEKLNRLKKPLYKELTHFYTTLEPPGKLPGGIELLYPYKDDRVKKIVSDFFKKYFSGNKKRSLMLGINPGRLGAGITGINFTAPRQLKENCGIEHPFPDSSEISAEFIYRMIESYGGASAFYNDWFIGSVCPLGFIKNGKNINYYDDPKLLDAVRPFIVSSINRQVEIGFNRSVCPCIGGEKNFKFLETLNQEYKWFKKIIPLPHPRFIMQYRRRQLENFIHQYLSVIRDAG